MDPPPPAERTTGSRGAEAFFYAACTSFATACARRETVDLWLRIARRTVRFRFAGARISEVIAPVFTHMQTSAQSSADLTILLWDTASTGIELPPIPWRPDGLDAAGKVRALCDARFTTAHEPDTGQFWMLDRQTATAVVWMNDVDAIPLWDRIHPLRKLLHAWARDFGADLVHAGAIGIDGAGVLVVGPGGTGKSTTVLAAMQAGLSAVGDDYVLVECGSSAGSMRKSRPGSPPGSPRASPTVSPLWTSGASPPGTSSESPPGTPGEPAPGTPRMFLPTAHALYGTMRLHRTHLDRFPALMTHHDHVFDEPWSGRAKVTSYISRHRPDRLTAELRLVGIVIPHVVSPQAARDHSPEITPESPGRALLALAPSSLLQVDRTDGEMFSRLALLCRRLPCWRLPLGPELAQVADRLIRLITAES